MPIVQCPRCGKRLTVSDWAPPVLTCPDCLARVENALATEIASAAPPPLPRRVIPLEYRAASVEYQAASDAGTAGILLFMLAALLLCAAWLTIHSAGIGPVPIVIVIVAALVLTTGVLRVKFPESREVQQASKALLAIIVALFLVIGGIFLLLLGLCAMMMSGKL